MRKTRDLQLQVSGYLILSAYFEIYPSLEEKTANTLTGDTLNCARKPLYHWKTANGTAKTRCSVQLVDKVCVSPHKGGEIRLASAHKGGPSIAGLPLLNA